MPITRKCKVCKELFQTLRSRIAKGNSKYCSRKCNSISQQKRVKRICMTCLKPFSAQKGMVKKGYRKFCNAQCYFKSEEVKIGGLKSRGMKRSEECKERLRKIRAKQTHFVIPSPRPNEKHHNWKGDDVGYSALHSWIRRKLGKAARCEECLTDKIPAGFQRYFQWANVSGEYKRDFTDWKQLCVKCHKAFDGYGTRWGN